MITTGILIIGAISIVNTFGHFTFYIEHIFIFTGFATGLVESKLMD